MATVNKRTKAQQALEINGVDAGGVMTAQIQYGYENIIESAPDGLQAAIMDREIQFCRGTVQTQDWIEILNILTGTVGTYVCYERKSGVAEATGYIEYTITNPIIHSVSLNQTKGGYMTCTFSFECRAADETEGFADMLAIADSHAAPTYIPAARGGFRVKTIAHGALSIYHTMSFTFAINLKLDKACNDADVGYTCVDARVDGLTAGGSITTQDSGVTTNALKAQQLLAAARGNLVITVAQGSGAADKVITIAGVIFGSAGGNQNVSASFTDHSLNYMVTNDAGTPLTLTGTNKILTIA